MSRTAPRVPPILPKDAGLLASKVEFGLLNCGCLMGKLFASRRNWKRARSPNCQALANDSWVQF